MLNKTSSKRQCGMALVMVMITIMVVAILGSAVITIAMGDIKQSLAIDRDMRAYYLAHSTADATMTYIKNKISDLDDLADDLEANIITIDEYNDAIEELEQVVPDSEGPINSSNSVSGIGNGTDKKVDSVQVWREDPYIYVKATATVESVSSSAIVRLNQDAPTNATYSIDTETEKTTYTEGLFEDAIYAANDITISGNSYNISGNVSCGGTFSGKDNVSGTITQNKTKTFEDWNVPATTDFSHTPTWFSSGMTITSNARYTSPVSMTGNTTINTGSGNDIILDFTNITISNNVTITAQGTGRVFIFANNMILGNKVSIISSQTKPFVYVIIDKDSTNALTLGGNGEWNAYIYAPTVQVDATHGTPNIYGAVICSEYIGKGTFQVDYRAPDLDEEDFEGGSSTTETETTYFTYTREGTVGTEGIKWLKEQ
jgi:hypothetical protein